VALGRGGIIANKREGDGGTPRGTFRPRLLWWRDDRHARPRTFLPVRAIRHADAWCEDPASRQYNQPIRLEPGRSGDRLERDDHLYDFIIEIDHNTIPRVAGRGSAVFLHLARENFGPTAG
jgi:L,D-peptidoglycan transpeptidase YkuD (ErfK/YbiS/YcfS/YnhG family)